MTKKIGIIGFGNMGEAIMGRLAGLVKNPRRMLIATDVDRKKLKKASAKYKISVTDDIAKVISSSDIVILAVKPKDFESLLLDAACYFRKGQIVVSIAAGITTSYIEKIVGGGIAVVRVMPNMPAIIGEAISSVSAGRFAARADTKAVCGIFSAIGEVVEVEEKLVDGVTAVSGSGPAYFFYLMESLIEAAMALGLKEKVATRLVFKTALGGSKLVESLGIHPGELRGRVTSKGGTTEAALAVLESGDFKQMIKRAVTRARDRSRELSKR